MTALESRAYNAGLNEGLTRAAASIRSALNIDLKGIITHETTGDPNSRTVLGVTAQTAGGSHTIPKAASMPAPAEEMPDMLPDAGDAGLETETAKEDELISVNSVELRRVHGSTAARKLKQAELRRDNAIETAADEMGQLAHCGEVKAKALVLLDCLEAHDPRAARAACEEFLKGLGN